MPRLIRAALLLCHLFFFVAPAQAQDPVPQPIPDEPIERFVFDARGVLARFKANTPAADALGVAASDLPTRGFGVTVGGHVYPLRRRNLALGVGGEVLLRARASRTKSAETANGQDGPTVVTRLTAISPQLSLNFGRRDGWSYLSGGMGWASFTSEIDERPRGDAVSRSTAINYGGGARWFTGKHLAVSLDLRFYGVGAQDAAVGRPALPSMRVMVFSAGISAR